MDQLINNQTRVFLSVAAQPGNFGATVFNALFVHYGINAVYIPRTAPCPEHLTSALRALAIAGCSVSMPLKSTVIPHLDDLSEEARRIGSVNTIINEEGVLTGHNTDFSGCLQVLCAHTVRSLIVYGSGSVVNSIVFAAKRAGISKIRLCGRNASQVSAKASELGVQAGTEPNAQYDLMVNATPAGDAPEDDIRALLPTCRGLFDLRVRPQASALELAAHKLGLWTVPGIEMAKFQLQKQFELYVGVLPPMELIDACIQHRFLEKKLTEG